LEMLIFNRWGQEIYSTTSIQHPWDGRSRGAPVPDGTYMYIMRWRDRCMDIHEERYGHVTLLR
jgi:gliding motility-associated-like protein